MANVTIYRFEVYDVLSDTFIQSRRWGTRDAIRLIAHGRALEATATEIDDSTMESDIDGLSVIDFDPTG